MENQNATTGQDLSQLKSMFADYQKKQTQSTTRKSREDILAKYFVPRKTKELFRILPPKAGRKHIEEAYFHVVTLNGAGGKKNHGKVVYCPAHNDPKIPKLVDGKPVIDPSTNKPVMIPSPCPLCAKHKKLIARQDQSLKGIKKENMNDAQKVIKAKNDEIYKEAIKWEAKKFYIVRGIDKGAEKDGVKFWRFKHNYKNQGTLDKLLPILEEYMSVKQADFSDAVKGTDLSIIMTDSEFNGHTYKTISAITYRGESPLHADPLVARQWLDDDITWRDVYLAKKAPNVTPLEFLEMTANGANPYWDDSDQNAKKWVFPGRPDLEEAANTRTRNLDADGEEDFEQASDLVDEEFPRVTISNITESKVGTYSDNASDLGAETLAATANAAPANLQVTQGADESSGDNYDDLPF
jgi:hypothetical protein